ncbi:MAG: phosphate ABC transporter substrate-binding protein PstS, partial [Tepidiformaceae bacterium]
MNFRTLRRGVLAAGLLTMVAAVYVSSISCCGDDNTSTPTAAANSATTAPTLAGNGGSPATGSIPADIGKDDSANITGAGATFLAPVYQAWFDDYHSKVAKGVKINYQALGSGAGIQQLTAHTVDFGASDAAMSNDELAKAPDAQHIPTVVGAITLAYNLNGLSKPLDLDGPTIAGIYLGKIKKWNDPAIAALNPGVSLPGATIQVVYRSDSSGTSFNFTDYLAKVSPDWKTGPGVAKAPNWPVGQGAKGNDGVTGIVKQTPNSIGYVELQYAAANNLSFADVKNAAGKFVTPSSASASAAAAGATIPDDYRTSITNASGDASYPITAMTYLLLYKSTGKCSVQR